MSQRVNRFGLSTLALVACVSLAACGPAFISPVLRDEEVTFDPALVGDWIEAEPEDPAQVQRAVVTGDSTHDYAIAYHDDDGKVNHFTGRLGRFAGRRVLELLPAMRAPDDEGAYAEGLMLPLRMIVVIESLDAREVRFSALEPELLERTLRAVPAPTPWVETEDERIVLTGDPERLREFLDGYLRRTDALGEPARFVRRSAR